MSNAALRGLLLLLMLFAILLGVTLAIAVGHADAVREHFAANLADLVAAEVSIQRFVDLCESARLLSADEADGLRAL